MKLPKGYYANNPIKRAMDEGVARYGVAPTIKQIIARDEKKEYVLGTLTLLAGAALVFVITLYA